MRGAVHDHLLAGDGRELVGHDAHGPAGRVRRAAPGRPSASTSGGVMPSWPSQNGQVAASAMRVVRPSAPGRAERPGATTTGTPVSGLRRRSTARYLRSRARAPAAGRSGSVARSSSCWCPRSRSGSAGSAAASAIGCSPITAAASASFADAWNSPSAAITFARRSRSASAWRAIARCIPLGISTSLTSTTLTLMPHGAVCSSMIFCRIWLILSRSESSSSSVCWPSTLRSVVCEICDDARREVGHLDDGRRGVDDAEVGDGVHAHRDVVAGDDLLRRHHQRDRAQLDLHHAIDDRDEQEEARAPSARRAGGRAGTPLRAGTRAAPARSSQAGRSRRRPAPRRR